MNGRYESDDLDDVHEGTPAADREISLGTGAMLGIFLALVLVCGAFFGFGYSMGHKVTPVASQAGSLAGDAEMGAGATPATDSRLKPAPGSSISDAPEVVVKPSAGTRSAPAAATPLTTTPPEASQAADDAPRSPKPAKPFITVPTTAAPAEAEAAPAASAGPPATPAVYVQISAVSHQEDAQLLLTALKRRGYDATVRHSPQDQLLHVQLGPFATKKDADAVKQRLSADGYNAILK